MSEKNQMSRRMIPIVSDKQGETIHSKAELAKISVSEHRAPLNPDRQTPGSQYSKYRKKKSGKDKNVTTQSNAQSSNSKIFEGGSNEKSRMNKFEQ